MGQLAPTDQKGIPCPMALCSEVKLGGQVGWALFPR